MLPRRARFATFALTAPIGFALVAAAAPPHNAHTRVEARLTAATSCAQGSAVDTSTLGVPLASDQINNAATIYNVAKGMGLPNQAAVVGIATALQESTLRNLTVAVDADSLGLFQQRPSTGWGTPSQIENPTYAATAFYHALVRIPGWQSLPVTVAAQEVQRSAFPSAYAKWEPLASQLVNQFSASSGGSCTSSPAS